jgi:hypothetical protein
MIFEYLCLNDHILKTLKINKMNKRILLVSALFLFGTSVFITSCSKDDDTTAPSISIIGDENMEIELQSGYTEQGATAVDDEDGTVDVSISGTVNDDLKGEYTITYTATDAAGNTASAERIVTVVNSADFLGGNYVNATDSCQSSPLSTFNATVTPSTTENGVFNVTNFGAFGSNVTVQCEYNSATDKITANTPQGLGGGTNLTNVFSASAVNSTSPVVFTIIYEWNDGGNSEICTSVYTK